MIFSVRSDQTIGVKNVVNLHMVGGEGAIRFPYLLYQNIGTRSMCDLLIIIYNDIKVIQYSSFKKQKIIVTCF